MKKTWWRGSLFIAASVLVARSEPASAEGSTAEPSQPAAPDTAAATFWEGKRLYDAGQYADALKRFESAYALTKDVVLLYDIAQCQRQLGECRAAKRRYREFQEQATSPMLVQRATEWLFDLEQHCPDPPSSKPATTQSQPLAATTPATVASATAAPATAAPAMARVAPAIRADAVRRLQTSPMDRHLVGQHPWQLSLAILAAGVATGATAAGVAIWNHHRHEVWASRDAELEKGNAPGESDLAWSVRQYENDELGNSIERTRRVTLALGVVSGAAVIASAASYFAFSGSKPGPTETGLSGRVTPSLTLGNYQLFVSGAF